MAQATVTQRVSTLEKTVEELATRQELHAVRDDLRTELHAVRDDLHAVRDELQSVRDDLRGEIRAGDQKTRDDLHASLEQRTAEIVAIIAASDEETRRYMRVLHEDVIERIERLRG